MKKLYYLPLALLLPLLAACSTEKPEAEPQAVAASFSQDFTLRYQQTARLPEVASPELTLRLDDLLFSICPSTANCLVPDHIRPTLTINGRDGQTQTLQLPSSGQLVVSSQYPDTTSVRANGRRYVLHFTDWNLAAGKQDNPTKQDFTISLRVEKPE